MAYDGLDRLVQVTDAPSFGGDGTAAFSYDVLDNMLSAKVGNKSDVNYAYDANNRLTNVLYSGGGTFIGLDYDEQGNVKQRNGTLLDFDYGNRLRSVGSTTYVYDGLGRRVRDLTGNSKYSLYSQAGQIVYDSDLRKGQQHWYVYLGNSLVAVREKTTSDGSVRNLYQHTDGLGSPVVITDASRNEVERNRYAPYGQLIEGPSKDGPGYTGHVMDAATGLTYMQQRYYDPVIGRFLSVDPMEASEDPKRLFNRYRYAANNPFMYVDPDGRLDAMNNILRMFLPLPRQMPQDPKLELADKARENMGASIVKVQAGAAVVGATGGLAAATGAATVVVGTAVRVGQAIEAGSTTAGIAAQGVMNNAINATAGAGTVIVGAVTTVEGVVASEAALATQSAAIGSQVGAAAVSGEFASGVISGAAGVDSPATSVTNAAGSWVGTKAREIADDL